MRISAVFTTKLLQEPSPAVGTSLDVPAGSPRQKVGFSHFLKLILQQTISSIVPSFKPGRAATNSLLILPGSKQTERVN